MLKTTAFVGTVVLGLEPVVVTLNGEKRERKEIQQ